MKLNVVGTLNAGESFWQILKVCFSLQSVAHKSYVPSATNILAQKNTITNDMTFFYVFRFYVFRSYDAVVMVYQKWPLENMEH